jgi:hypothetical protein
VRLPVLRRLAVPFATIRNLSDTVPVKTFEHHRVKQALLALSALAIVCAEPGCGSTKTVRQSEGSHPVARPAPPHAHPVRSVPARCTTAAVPLGTSRAAYAALVPRLAVAHSAPGGGPIVGRFGHLDVNRFPTILGVIGMRTSRGCQPAWYRVQLPVLPNGTTGWVPARAVQLFRVRSRIVIGLSTRRLRLYRSGRLVLETTVAVGAPKTPTPVGSFFVNERYILESDDGPFGPYALGISAHSDALAKVWVQNGPIALHGTNEPWTIGQAASHGCIRIRNDVIRRLFALTPAGTPVIVQA